MSRPKLINEAVYGKLKGDDRRDYVSAVKYYNQTGEVMFLRAAEFFENGKRNLARFDPSLMRRVQSRFQKLNKRLSQREISEKSGISITYIYRISYGYCTGLNDALLAEMLAGLNKINMNKLRRVG